MTPRSPDADRMLEMVRTHARCERERDLVGVMATLVKEPVYILWNGLRIEGYDRVREFYRRQFEGSHRLVSGGARSIINYWAGEDFVVIEAEVAAHDPLGELRLFNVVATFPFSEGLASGEIVACLPEFEPLLTASHPDYSDLGSQVRW